VLAALRDQGLPYRCEEERNVELLTALGTSKISYAVPETMWPGVKALAEKTPCLLVDFAGLKDYSAKQIVAAMKSRWPMLRALRLPFAQQAAIGGEITTESLARHLDLPALRRELVQAIKPHLGEAQAVGLPAVLGFEHSVQATCELAEELAVPVFEIPTPPVSVPGLRLQQALQRLLERKGAKLLLHQWVVKAEKDEEGHFLLSVSGTPPRGPAHSPEPLTLAIRAKAVILASGRFWGGGLVAEQTGIREPLFSLPVQQPASREAWHQQELCDPRGHAINQAGLRIDATFRPLDQAAERPLFRRLFAAGSILGDQDWMRSKSGAGLALATAYGAVQALTEELGAPGERAQHE
jgi:glycerol-3-phosphate dehydrogenase subunit B